MPTNTLAPTRTIPIKPARNSIAFAPRQSRPHSARRAGPGQKLSDQLVNRGVRRARACLLRLVDLFHDPRGPVPDDRDKLELRHPPAQQRHQDRRPQRGAKAKGKAKAKEGEGGKRAPKAALKLGSNDDADEEVDIFGETTGTIEMADMMKEKMAHAKKAAVMVLFYPDSLQRTNVVLILRKTYKGVHSAQIGFPGGKVEKEDKSLLESAVRETEEEVGVKRHDIDVLKSLSNVYIPPSNYSVYPFIGVLEYTPCFVKQDDEVEDILEISLMDLLSDSSIVTRPVKTSYDIDVEVPAFLFKGHTVWGATAMILSEVKELLKQII